MLLHHAAVRQPVKMLQNLEAWIDKAVAFAESRSFDPEVLLQARLAPDQYALVRQIQAVCDSAKFLGARLGGVEPPRDPDTEVTWLELRTRIRTTLAFLETITPAMLEGAEHREVELNFAKGKRIRGSDYLDELALPNMYFHLVTAYAILRHNGVPLGKTDFIGSLPLQDAED